MRKIILASSSPRRRELLQAVGVKFEVKPGNGEEIIGSNDPKTVVEELSRQKAHAAADYRNEEGTLVLGADTVVSFRGQILGKPKSRTDAIETLRKLQGNTHQVYTGVTMLEFRNNRWNEKVFSECTDVTFYPVPMQEIERYVDSGEPMDKAGSYGIQGSFGIYVKEIRGEYSNVVGLPVGRLFYEAGKLGIKLKG